MQVAKWDGDLAIRLPATIVEALDLKEGDEIELLVVCEKSLAIARNRSRSRTRQRIRALQRLLPPGWRFDREDANRR